MDVFRFGVRCLRKKEESRMKLMVRRLLEASIIAALYVALTLVFAPISYGPVQVRISEVLSVLPFFTPAAVPGLAIGCLIANLFSSFGLLDIVFGTLATLLAALVTYKIKRKWLAPLPPVIINGAVIGAMIYFMTDKSVPLLILMGQIALGELLSCYVLGIPLLYALEPLRNKIFKRRVTK